MAQRLSSSFSSRDLCCRDLCVIGASFSVVMLAANLPKPVHADPYQPVTTQQLNNAASAPGWLMYNRDYTGRNYAPFGQITPENVGSLAVVWKSDKFDIPN